MKNISFKEAVKAFTDCKMVWDCSESEFCSYKIFSDKIELTNEELIITNFYSIQNDVVKVENDVLILVDEEGFEHYLILYYTKNQER